MQNNCSKQTDNRFSADIIIVGGTPGGISAAIASARLGYTSIILERTRHIGGLPANGLGATDICTRGATGGLFLEFTSRIRNHYLRTYGKDSEQVKDSSDGYHFEPSVAEKIFEEMLVEYPQIAIRRLRQFDALPSNVELEEGRLRRIFILNRETGGREIYEGKIFIDATYEGDLAAASGALYRLGREGNCEYREPMSGVLYKFFGLGGKISEESTGLADNAIQSYNYRLPLTRSPALRRPIAKPADYRREEYLSLVEDIVHNRTILAVDCQRPQLEFNGIGRVVNMVRLPNEKTDANNQHAAFLSTDLPEENWPWPTSGWAWRDHFAARLRDYTLGLLYFCQNDPALPEDFRERCAEWGLAGDEYEDNGNFPRQVYVREGRRIMGKYLFTAHDALPAGSALRHPVRADSHHAFLTAWATCSALRPPVHADSITASHYFLDSHAVRKREEGKISLDGIFSYPTKPYTVPYGVIVPQVVRGLLIPVPVSTTHIGFSTLRMEPCWMALGQAAGASAALCVKQNISPEEIRIEDLQKVLLAQGAVLIYYTGITPEHPAFPALQFLGLKGFFPEWEADLDKTVSAEEIRKFSEALGIGELPTPRATALNRGEFLKLLSAEILRSGDCSKMSRK